VITDGNEDGELEVERIVAHRAKKGRREYLVLWKGYDLADATWEPESGM